MYLLRFFIGFITIFITAIFIGALIICIILGEGLWMIGGGALIGFYIAWTVAGGVIFSPLTYFVLSDWDLFKKRMRYSIAGSGFGALSGLLIGYLVGYF